MLFNRDLKRTAAIRIRPLGDGMLLYFPFGFDKGGPGFVVPEAQGKVLRYREWSPFHFVFVPTMLVMLLIGVLSGSATWGYVLGGLEGLVLGELFRRYQEILFERMTKSLPSAPYQMTEERYWQEMAVQYSRMALFGMTVFTGVLVLAVIVSMVGNFVAMFQSAMVMVLHLFAGVFVVIQVRKTLSLLRGRAQAKRCQVEVGSLMGLAAR